MDIKAKLRNVLKLALEGLEAENKVDETINMMTEVMTVDGDTIFTESEAFVSGVPVFVKKTTTGEVTPLIAGEYLLQDGSKLIVVADGLLDSLVASNVDVTPLPEPNAEVEVELEDEKTKVYEERITALEAEIKEMKSKLADQTKTEEVILKMSAVIDDLSKPVVESILKLSKEEKEKIALQNSKDERPVAKYRKSKLN